MKAAALDPLNETIKKFRLRFEARLEEHLKGR